MKAPAATQTMQVCLGEHAIPVGTLTYSRQGVRENTLFVYDDAWLENENRFEISPDLPLARERYFHKAATRSDSIFHFAIADTEPDGWGCKVIARDHAKRRKAGDLEAGAAEAVPDVQPGLPFPRPQSGGPGIGLMLARRLAEMHGGTLTVRSDGPDKGSEFTLRLPLSGKNPIKGATISR